jgi:hypothetical protein
MIIELYGKSNYPERQNEVKDFYNKIANASNSYLVTGQMCWLELPYAVTGSYVTAAQPKKKIKRKEIIRNNPSIIKQAAIDTEHIKELLFNDINHIFSDQPELSIIQDEALNLMKNHTIEFWDASHIVQVTYDKILYLATLDYDYIEAGIPNITYLTCTDLYSKYLQKNTVLTLTGTTNTP